MRERERHEHGPRFRRVVASGFTSRFSAGNSPTTALRPSAVRLTHSCSDSSVSDADRSDEPVRAREEMELRASVWRGYVASTAAT